MQVLHSIDTLEFGRDFPATTFDSARVPLRDVHARSIAVKRAITERLDSRFPHLRNRLRMLGWLWLAAIVLAALLIPSTRGVWTTSLALQLYVLQLFLLARSKTLSWRGVGLAFACGLLVVAPLCAYLSLWYVGHDHHGFEATLYLRQVAPVTLAGPIEEILKLLPVVLVLAFAPTRARSLSVVDFTLLGFASGSGFALAEDGTRHIVTYGKGPSLGDLLNPAGQHTSGHGFFEFLGSQWSSGYGTFFAGHAVTTAIVATCIGLMWRSRRRLAWMALPVAALAIQIMDHCLFNWSMNYGSPHRFLDHVDAGSYLGRSLHYYFPVQPPKWLFDFYALLGSGNHREAILVFLVAVGLVVDYHSIALSPSFEPLPGRTHGADLLRWIASRSTPNAAVRMAKLAVVETLRTLLMILREVQLQVTAVTKRRGLVTMAALRQQRIKALRRQPFTANLAMVAAAVVAVTVPLVIMGAESHVLTVDNQAFFAPLFDQLGDWWGGLPLGNSSWSGRPLSALLLSPQ